MAGHSLTHDAAIWDARMRSIKEMAEAAYRSSVTAARQLVKPQLMKRKGSRTEMDTDARALAIEYVKMIGDKNYDRLAGLLHEKVEVTGMAGAKLQGREQFVAGPARLAPIILGTEMRDLLVDGNKVQVTYDLITDTAAGSILSTELLSIEGGLIRSSLLIFDSRRWPEAMRELQRRNGAQVGT